MITWANVGEWWSTDYKRDHIDGLADDLADGEAFTSHDGCAWTRHGDEMLVMTPGRAKLAARSR